MAVAVLLPVAITAGLLLGAGRPVGGAPGFTSDKWPLRTERLPVSLTY